MKYLYWPCTSASREGYVYCDFTKKQKNPVHVVRLSVCEITKKQVRPWIITEEIFRIVIINIYTTHRIFHWVNYYLIHFNEFATNINPAYAELMRNKAFPAQESLWLTVDLFLQITCFPTNALMKIHYYCHFYFQMSIFQIIYKKKLAGVFNIISLHLLIFQTLRAIWS